MRKIIIFLLTLALLLSLPCTAMAAESGLSLSNGGGQPGQTVYLTVKLNESLVGDSIGLSYSFDSSVLEAVPGFCSWSVKGVLQDFDSNHQGVWATDTAKDLKGNLCVLAFTIRSGIRFNSTTVSCTVAIQSGTDEVGKYTAEAKISLACNHEYGNYTDQGAVGHGRECGLCGGKQTQPHEWDGGVLKENPDSRDTDWKVITCTVCGGTQIYEVPKSEEAKLEETKPSTPPETYPTLPTVPRETEPEYIPHYTRPTTPNRGDEDHSYQDQNQNGGQNNGGPTEGPDHETPYHDYNEPRETTDESGNVIISGDSHIYIGEEEELPLIIQSNDSGEHETQEQIHDHDTTVQIVTAQQRKGNLLLVVALLAAMFGAGFLYLKKKK